MKRLLVLLCLWLSAFGVSMAQIIPGARAELDYDKDFFINAVYNCHENGLVVSTSENAKRSERDPDRLYLLFDTTLTEIMSMKIEVPFRQKITNTFASKTTLYTFYYDLRFGDFTVVGIDPSKIESQRFTGKLPSKMISNGFAVYNGFAVVCNVSKRSNEVYIIDLKSGKHQVFALEQQIKHGVIDILDVRPFDDGLELGVVYKEHNRSSSKTYLMIFDEEGQKVQFSEIGNEKYNIISATSTKLLDGGIVVSGTYATNSIVSANGMFIALYNGGHQEYIKIRPFSEMNNFFNYMSERGQETMRRKVERSNDRGRDLSINVLMLVHPVQAVGEDLVVMGEVYYPTYRTVSNTTYINGRPVNNTTQVFDGYQYSHAAMLKFKHDGQFVNDYCFPIYLWRKPFTLKRIVQMQTTNGSIKLAYMNANVLKSKVFINDKQEEQTFNLQANDNDKIRYTSGEVDYWYGNYFVSSGYQNIRSGGDFLGRKRDVFYMQKILIK